MADMFRCVELVLPQKEERSTQHRDFIGSEPIQYQNVSWPSTQDRKPRLEAHVMLTTCLKHYFSRRVSSNPARNLTPDFIGASTAMSIDDSTQTVV